MESEIVTTKAPLDYVLHKKAGTKSAKHRSAQKDQSTKLNLSLPTYKPEDNESLVVRGSDLPKHRDTPEVSTTRPTQQAEARPTQKVEAPNRWSKALGSISQPSPASATALLQSRSVNMAPGAPAGRQALKATQQQQLPPAKAAQQQQLQKPVNKTASVGTSQEKEQILPSALGKAAVRFVPRNSNSPSNPARRTSSGGSSTGGSSVAGNKQAQSQPQVRDGIPANQHQQSRNWAGIVSQRSQAPPPKHQLQQQHRQSAPAMQAATIQEPFPPLSGDGPHKEPAASHARTWPAPPAHAAGSIGSKVAPQQPAGNDTAEMTKFSTAQVAAASARPAAGSIAPAITQQDRTTTAMSAVNKEQGGRAWIPKHHQQQPLHSGSGDSLSGRDTQSPRRSRAARGSAGGAGRSASHKSLESSSSTTMATANVAQVPEQAVPVSTAPVGLPPTPSSMLTTKASSAAAAAATAAAAGVAAAAAAAAPQLQHKAVNLPSSQEVNTAAMFDYASNRTTTNSSTLGYRASSAAAEPPPPPAKDGFDAFGAGFGPNGHNEGNYSADSFGVAETEEKGGNYSSQAATAAIPSSAPTALPAAQAPAVAPVPAVAVAPAAAGVPPESSSSDASGVNLGDISAGAYQPEVATDQDPSKVQDYSSLQDYGRSSSTGMVMGPSSTSSNSSLPTSSLNKVRGLSADAPAFQFKAPTLIPTQVHAAAQLEQQMFATAQGSEASKPAVKPAMARLDSSDTSSAAPVAGDVSLVAQLRQLADKFEQENIAYETAAATSAEKIHQLQQQVDAARAGQAAAEAKVSGLSKELEAERMKVKDFESQLASQSSYAASNAERADALAAEVAAAAQMRDVAQLEANQHIQALQQQVRNQQLALVDLEDKLRQWQDKYNSTEADNRGLRDMLGPRAPAPGTLVVTTPTATSTVASSGAFIIAAPAAAPAAPAQQHRPAAKAPPPGFGPAPVATVPQPAAPTASAAAEARHMKNEHEIVSTLLSMLHVSSHAAIFWADDETAGLDVQLLPLNWDTHYSARYGSVISFMQQRPAVFSQRQDGAFYKVQGAEEMVKKAMADEEERAREDARAAGQAAAVQAAAAAEAQARGAGVAPWHVPQFGADLDSNGAATGAASGPSSVDAWSSHQQQQQHVGMPSSAPFPPNGLAMGMGASMPYMPHHQHLLMGPGTAGLPQASMPLAPPTIPMGHGMHHQPHHRGHRGHPQW